MTSITLNETNSNDLLKQYVNAGYKSSGALSIEQGAKLHRYFRILSGQEKDDSLSKEDIYKFIFSAITAFNNRNSFNIDDAAVINEATKYIQNNVINEKSEEVKEV